jgi:flagellar hook-associated protein 3 FlgL
MRIATYTLFNTGVNNLQRRQQDLASSQEQMTTGKRVARVGDDPAAAARAERAMIATQRADANQRALDASRSAMMLAESALGEAGELMQQARDTVMAAGNPSYTDAEREMLVLSLRGLRDQLLVVANRADGVGTFLFGGQGSASPPFVDAPGGVQYQGSDGQTQVDAGQPVPLAIDGRHAWLEATNPVAGDPPLSLFDTLDRVIGELSTPGRGDPEVAQTVHDGLRDLDASLNHLLVWRARAGETLNRQDSLENRIADARLGAQYERSLAEDLDMVQAISEFQTRQTGYDAALRAYSTVQRMSLFNYING